MNDDVLDDARNWAEENLFGGGREFIESRQARGRALEVSGPNGTEELLGESPFFKARAAFKMPLVEPPLGARGLAAAWSLSLTSPAFGSHAASANESLQVMGGLGYTEETLVEYCVRRSRGWMIAGGSIEMMKNRLAESIFERRFSQRPPKSAR